MSTLALLPWCRRALGAALVLAFLALAGTRSARAHLIFFKDGFVLEGDVRRETKLEIDPYSHEAIQIPKSFFQLDDGPRRIWFSHQQVGRIEEQKGRPPEERVVHERFIAYAGPRRLPPIEQVTDVTDWDNKEWERNVTLRTTKGTITLRQHLGVLTPYYFQTDTIAKTRYPWRACYLTKELTPEAVRGLLGNHPQFQEDAKLSEAEKAARRFRYFDFFTQAGWFDEAAAELKRIEADLPSQKERVETARAGLLRIRAREELEEIKRRHQAGQFDHVRKRLADFPEKGASDQTLADLRSLRAEYEALGEKGKLLARYLTEISAELKGQPQLVEAAAVVRDELQPGNLGRLDTFLGQAKQAERQRKDGKKPEASPAELLSLAITGWLLGDTAAKPRPEAALGLWRARQMVLEYQRTGDVGERKRLLDSYHQHKGYPVTLDEIVTMIPNLPPPEAEKDFSPRPVTLQAGGPRGRGTAYELQLPPEYRHSRPFPVLIVLHEAGEKPADALRRWAQAAADNGYVLAAPAWEQGSLRGGYTFSEREHATVLDTLRDLRRRFQIDSDRVFLAGLGQGGRAAFDIGLSHPDLFAGVLPMGAGPDLFAERYWRNAQYLPFYIVTGDRSGDATQNTRDQFNHWVPRGYPTLWIQYKGRGIEWFAGEVPVMFDWMRTKRRAFPLHQLGTDGNRTAMGNEFQTMRQSDNHFYWLSTDAIAERSVNTFAGWRSSVYAATLTARIDTKTNEIYARVDGVKQLTIWLGRDAKGESMIDWNRPVGVKINLASYWNKKVTPSLETLLEDLFERGDRQQLFLARLDFRL